MYGGRTEFRPARWLYMFLSVMLVAVFFATIAFYRIDGPGWTTISLGVFTIIASGGLVELFVTSLSLHEDSLAVKSLFRDIRIERKDIESVCWEKGVGISLRLKDGSWAKLPEAIEQGQGLTNSLRAWLKNA